MTFAPLPEDAGRIRGWLAAYRVSAWVTGVFLLLLVVMMIVRYGFAADLAIGWPDQPWISMGPRDLTPGEDPTGSWPPGVLNLSTIILIVHGWLYVVYLVIDFAMWRLCRYSFGYFLFVALGGVIPFLSFFFEWRVPRDIRRIVARLETQAEDESGRESGNEVPA